MGYPSFVEQYWPFLVLALWFGYRWWSARRVVTRLPSLRQQGATVVDVRSLAEFAGGNAPGSVNIPLPELGSRLDEIPKNAPVVVCCASGTRSGMAKLLLKKHGYPQVFNVGPWRNLMR